MQVGRQNRDCRPISDFGIDDWWSVINTFDRGVIYSTITVDACLWHRPPCISKCCLWQASTSTAKTTEQNLRIGKSEAEVTNNKRLRSRYFEANCRQTRSIARPLCNSRDRVKVQCYQCSEFIECSRQFWLNLFPWQLDITSVNGAASDAVERHF